MKEASTTSPLALRIKELRSERGITQRQLAEKTGIAYSTIVGYENGKREPNCRAMAALEDFFGVTGKYLCGDDSRREAPHEKKTSAPAVAETEGNIFDRFTNKEIRLFTRFLLFRGIGEGDDISPVQMGMLQSAALILDTAFPVAVVETDLDNMSSGA